MKKQFTDLASDCIEQAHISAIKLKRTYIGTDHILLGLTLIDDSVAQKVLSHHGVTYNAIFSNMVIEAERKNEFHVIAGETFSPKAKHVLEAAGEEAERNRSKEVGTEHLLIALLKEKDCAAERILNGIQLNRTKVLAEIFTAMGEDLKDHKDELQPEKQNNKKQKEKLLEQFSTDMNQKAREGKLDPIIGRAKEVKRIVQILSRRTKNNPCLVGEPGVGKTAICEALAQKIVDGEIAGPVSEKRILSLDLPAMVAGSKYRGEFEDRIKKVINEVKEDGNIILFMDEIHTMIGAGSAEGSIDAANILKPALSRGEIQIIGATTLDEYRKHFEKDAALERRFQPVQVEQPTKEETVEILKGIRSKYEEHHNVEITDEAVSSAVDLSMRYINDRFLPDKAIDLIDEAASKVRLSSYILSDKHKKMDDELKSLLEKREKLIIQGRVEKASDINFKIEGLKDNIKRYESEIRSKDIKDRLKVGSEDIADVVSVWTKIPVKKLAEEESAKLLDLDKTLKKRVISQDEAVNALAKAIKRGRVGLKDPNKPIGTFLFLGPTGVGKTELSKALAEALFGTENSIIRVDMSEYMEKHSVSKLIGSPPGYVGYDEGGQLSEAVRRNPYSIILFDEIEKAHPDVFNILLQVLDDGRITDSHGRVTDFKNTIIIMTSNAGAMRIMEPKNLGFATDSSKDTGYNKMKEAVMDEVKRIFKPEFLNRIDEIIVFRALEKEDMKAIGDIILEEIIKRAKDQMQIKLEVSDKARSFMAEKGFDKKYGARPLKRQIQTLLEDELAEEILSGKIKAGDRVKINSDMERLSFKTLKKPGRKAKNGESK